MASNVKVLTQYLKEVNFEIKDAPDVFLRKQEKPDIEISIDLDVKKISEKNDIKIFENTIRIKAEAKEKNIHIFTCEIAYSGIFSLSEIEENMLEQILLIYCPNLLFPYLRQVVSNIVSSGGFPPLMLEPIDFAMLYANRKKIEKQDINKTKH